MIKYVEYYIDYYVNVLKLLRERERSSTTQDINIQFSLLLELIKEVIGVMQDNILL